MPGKKAGAKSKKKLLKKSRLSVKNKEEKSNDNEKENLIKSTFSRKSLKKKAGKKTKNKKATKAVSKRSIPKETQNIQEEAIIKDIENNEFYEESSDLEKAEETDEYFYEEEEDEEEDEEELNEEEEEEDEEEEDDVEEILKGPIIYFQTPVLKTSTENFKYMQFSPPVPSTLEFHIYEQILYKAVLKISAGTNPLDIIVQVLTNQKDSRCPNGEVHPIRLRLRGPTKSSGLYVYGASSILVCAGQNFTFNYRAKHVNDLVWTNPPLQPTVKGSAKVLEMDPNYLHPQMKNIPNFHYIDKNLYIGDAVALENVPSLTFTDVLCVDADLPDPSWKEDEVKIKRIKLSSFINPNGSVFPISKFSHKADLSSSKDAETERQSSLKNSAKLSEITEKKEPRLRNLSEISDKTLSEIEPVFGYVSFHRIPFPSNSEIPFDKYMLLEAVNWIQTKLLNSKHVLIVSTHCFRRAPNVVLAYLYKKKVRDTLINCHRFITCKRPMVLTHDLYNTIQNVFPANVSETNIPEISFSGSQLVTQTLQKSNLSKN